MYSTLCVWVGIITDPTILITGENCSLSFQVFHGTPYSQARSMIDNNDLLRQAETSDVPIQTKGEILSANRKRSPDKLQSDEAYGGDFWTAFHYALPQPFCNWEKVSCIAGVTADSTRNEKSATRSQKKRIQIVSNGKPVCWFFRIDRYRELDDQGPLHAGLVQPPPDSITHWFTPEWSIRTNQHIVEQGLERIT